MQGNNCFTTVLAVAFVAMAICILAQPSLADDGSIIEGSNNLRKVDLPTDEKLHSPANGACSTYYYYDDTVSSGYAWPLPQDSSDWFGVHFTNDPVSACTLNVVRIKLYRPYMTGTPDLHVAVYDDDGFGLPGTILVSVTIPYGSLPSESFGWAVADFSSYNLVFSAGDEYHICFETIGGEGDTLYPLTDTGAGPYAGEERSVTHYQGGGLWYTLYDLYGVDFVFMIEAEVCCGEPFPGVTISQMDWALDDSVAHNTAWGRIGVAIETFTEALSMSAGYLNAYTDTGWVIQNLIVDTNDHWGEASTNFDLGIPNGTALDLLSMYFTFTSEPKVSHGDGPRVFYPVQSDTIAVGGIDTIPFTSVPDPPGRVEFEGKGATSGFRQTQWDVNIECAYSQCAPCAVSNNLQYLENRYGTDVINVPHDHLMGLKGDNTLVGQLDTYMNRPVIDRRDGSGVKFSQWIGGKCDYISGELTDNLDHHFQIHPVHIGLPGNFPCGNSIAKDDTEPYPSYINFEWVRQRFEDGEAIELGLWWMIGEYPAGGHAVRVNGGGYILGKAYLRLLHDHNQDNDSKGLENPMVFVEPNTIGSWTCPRLTTWNGLIRLIIATGPEIVMIRDCVADVGTEPDPDCPVHWESPDIYINNYVNGPIDKQDPPLPGQMNKLYFVATNLTNATITDVTVSGFYVEASMGLRFPGAATFIDIAIFPPIPPLGKALVGMKWLVPPDADPGHTKYKHYCVGAVLHVLGDPPHYDVNLPDNNVAQINMNAMYQRAGQNLPKPAPNNDQWLSDTSVFRSVINGYNPTDDTANFMPVFDSATLAALPTGWTVSFEDEGPFWLEPDSSVELEVTLVAPFPQHNDSAVVSTHFVREDNPSEIIGGATFAYCIDEYPPVPVNDLTATVVSSADTTARLTWTIPTTDTTGGVERIRGYYIFSDTGSIDTGHTAIDTVAIDADPELTGFQWYDTRPVSPDEKRYYRVSSIDGSKIVSEMSNEDSVQVGCCNHDGIRGDADYTMGVDVGDLTYLVAYLFQGGPAPPCMEEGDVDGSGGIDVGDLTWLVSYLFQGGPPPPPC
ncbi:MAG: hypothetical protein ABII79_11445 [bacterium]